MRLKTIQDDHYYSFLIVFSRILLIRIITKCLLVKQNLCMKTGFFAYILPNGRETTLPTAMARR